MRPATEKRQGTKSREIGQERCSGRYGDLMLAPASMTGTTVAREELGVRPRASGGACNEEFGRVWERMTEQLVR
jgi:hypothetical protein